MSEIITLEELKQHCIKTIEACEQIKRIPNVRITDDRRSQEHKLILQLIEEHEQRQSTDAISRSKAIEETLKYKMTSGVTNQGTWNECVHVIAQTLADSDALPTVTPERPKGEWKYTDEVHEIARCSKCRFLIDASGCVDPEEYISIYRYCPNCGADMRREEQPI